MTAQHRVHRALAPAKVNLGLFVGAKRAQDGKHELVTVMQSISLADELTIEDAPPAATEDEILCPGVSGSPRDNLASAALRAFRESTSWDAPPQRLSIHKRIPVAAGLGGGSADAAATLRLAMHVSGLGDEQLLLRLGAELGADVPAQISPGRWLATGAGEQLHELPTPRSKFGLLVLPADAALSTADVYAEADRLGLAHDHHALEERRQELASALEHGAPLPAATELLHNDLQRAAASLCREIADALRQTREVGADVAFVSGSGPTVVGLFARGGGGASDYGLGLAEQAADRLPQRVPAPICAVPVDASFGGVLQTSDARVRNNPSEIQ